MIISIQLDSIKPLARMNKMVKKKS